ncbi:MAG: serine/threonine-protein kinase [Deltaproteobacteria bacterium]|nr:serine/threonine-protein kinase [Deltaproteobacteria bacterium]
MPGSAAIDGDDADVFPRVFGAYTLLALLGKGGMGEVFLAARTGIEGISRRCVVKTLRPGFGDDREYVSRFLDEARVVSQLHHRNICPVFDVGKIGERHYLAMEYIAGRDLKSIAERARDAGTPFSMPVSLHVVSEVLEALDYAHGLCDAKTDEPLLLVHRDVSPHNVMIGFDGDVRLIDFGLAASTLKVEQTAPNVVMGKVSYMAPEHICGEMIDARADQYAAAVMATELLIGSRFYEARSVREIYPLASPGGFRPAAFSTLPASLRAILDKALAARVDERFPSCGELREALDSWRFEHHPGREAPALRQLVRHVFAADIASDRALLSRVAAEAGMPTHHVVTTSVPSLVARLDDTAREAPADPTSRHDQPARDLAPTEATHATQSAPAALATAPFGPMPVTATTTSPVTRAPPAPSTSSSASTSTSTMPMRAAAALAGVAAVAVIVMISVNALSETTTTTTEPVAPVTSPLASTTTILSPVPALTPIVSARVSTPAPIPPPAEPVPVPVARPVVIKKADGKTPPSSSSPPGTRLRWLFEHCPELACARPLKARASNWAGLEGEAQAAFQDDLRACFLRCTR